MRVSPPRDSPPSRARGGQGQGLLGDPGRGCTSFPSGPRSRFRRDLSRPSPARSQRPPGRQPGPQSARPPAPKRVPRAAHADRASRPPAHRDIGEPPGASLPPPSRVPGASAVSTRLPSGAPGGGGGAQIAIPCAYQRQEPPPGSLSRIEDGVTRGRRTRTLKYTETEWKAEERAEKRIGTRG